MRPRGARVIVMAKAPRPGRVKTRLAQGLGSEAAACALARAFLLDVWRSVEGLPWAQGVIAGDALDMGVPGAPVWPQGEGDLGERLERVIERALRDAGAVIVVGSDSPGLPMALLEEARAALERADAAIGPCSDGGFYLLGLRRHRPGLLGGLPWSAASTHAATLARLRAEDFDPVELARWFDVDDVDDLRRLINHVEAGWVHAPSTLAALRRLDLLEALRRRTP
ncbi:MAG: TIGR04282 family arsenosugar biosynthesis glycosyltransferase [Planctomycetes bacterium]|nr:TIGR04282 family arsenosugar biosynthesis glycosyltransferase [Planctomycetota bacterium]